MQADNNNDKNKWKFHRCQISDAHPLSLCSPHRCQRVVILDKMAQNNKWNGNDISSIHLYAKDNHNFDDHYYKNKNIQETNANVKISVPTLTK